MRRVVLTSGLGLALALVAFVLLFVVLCVVQPMRHEVEQREGSNDAPDRLWIGLPDGGTEELLELGRCVPAAFGDWATPAGRWACELPDGGYLEQVPQ